MGESEFLRTGLPAGEGERDAELYASLVIRHTKGIGPRTWKRLLQHFGTAVHAGSNVRSWQAHRCATKGQEKAFIGKTGHSKADTEYADVMASGMDYVLFSDPAYPARLKEIPDPPILLYALGDISRLGRPCLGVVGSRKCSSYAARMTRTVCSRLSDAGLTIVSGFACGVDRIAHETGSMAEAGTIAVLGTGLDIIYPASNRDIWEPTAARGLILSEFAPHTLPDARNFPYRNRLISGLSLGVLVVQAAAKSGSLITARLAMEQNREVFAVPGPVGADYGGCHELIQSGAKLVQDANDVLEEVQTLLDTCWPALSDEMKPPASRPSRGVPGVEAGSKEEQVLQRLQKETKIHIDTLTQGLGWESNTVSQTLIMLEIKQLVRQYPGMLYSLF